MPIKGLTDRAPSLPQIGILRKGAVKPEKGIGADLTHFRFDTDDATAASAFRAAYGDEPRSIRVFVPFPSTDENFEAWREEWSASSLRHRCDGQTCVRHLTAKGTYSDEPIACPGGCKQVGRLKVIIPELKRFALVTVLTTSIHDILEVHSNLLALETARGSLQGIPMILSRSPREISTPAGDGKRVRREKWLISIEAQPQWVELQLAAQEREALPAGAQLLLNPQPEDFEDESDDAPAPATVDPRDTLIAEARRISTEMGATEDAWTKYHNKYLAGKPLDAIEARVAEIRSKAAAKAQASADDLLASIERERTAILDLDGGQGDIDAAIALVAGGVCDLNQIEPEAFPAILSALIEMRAEVEAMAKAHKAAKK